MSPSPLGETLRRSRTAQGIKLEDAERVTRIPRKYLEALELENFGILPAPVYARGFLRSYAGFLGLEANDLLPFFPVGHVDEPILEELPAVHEPRTWNMNGIVAMGVVGMLILLVVGLYSLGHDDGSAFTQSRLDPNTNTNPQATAQVIPDNGGVAASLPDLVGQTQQQAISVIQGTGAEYIVTTIAAPDVASGQVIEQSPGAGEEVGPGDLVTITVAQ